MNVMKLSKLLKYNNFLQNAFKYNKMCITKQNTKYSTVPASKKLTDSFEEAMKLVNFSYNQYQLLFEVQPTMIKNYIKELDKTDHPFRDIIRKLRKNEIEFQEVGVIIALISKSAGLGPFVPKSEIVSSSGILNRQQKLAKQINIYFLSYRIHQSVMNMKNIKDENLLWGNKVALLMGDFFLQSSYIKLVEIMDHDVITWLMHAAQLQFSSQFIQPRDHQSFPLPSKPVPANTETDLSFLENEPVLSKLRYVDLIKLNAKSQWTAKALLDYGNYIGVSCKSALKLASLHEQIQVETYKFGVHFALAWKAYLDLEAMKTTTDKPYNLMRAPIIFHLESNPTLYNEIEKGMDSITNIDMDFIKKEVLSGPGIAKTKQLIEEHSQIALDKLAIFPDSEARTALKNIICAFKK